MKISKQHVINALGLWMSDFNECKQAVELTIKICKDYPAPQPSFIAEKISSMTALVARLDAMNPYAESYDDQIEVAQTGNI